MLSQRTHTSLSLSLCASARFSAHTPLSRSLSVRQLSSARTHLSLALSLCVSSVQRAHTSLLLSLCASAQFSTHTPLSRSLSVRQLSSARTHLSLALSLCASARFSARQLRCNALSQIRYYYISNFTCRSIAEITAQLLALCYVYLISSDDGSIIRIFVQINILEGRAGSVVLMGHISVTISYSFRCLKTETVKYINENCFIENLAASKHNMWAQRGKQM